MARQASTRRAGINIASQWLAMIVATVVNLFLIAYVVSKVGKDHYGGWTSIASIIGYLTLLDAGMSIALQHFLAGFVARGEKKSMAALFSSAYVVYGASAGLALIGCLAVSQAYPVLFPKVSPEAATECVVALRWIAFAMVVFMLNLPLQGALLSLQKYAVLNAIEVTSLLLRASTVLLLFHFLGPSLGHLGVAFFTAVCARFMLNWIILRRIEPALRVRPSFITRQTLAQLLTYGGHSMLWTISNVVVENSGPILANIFLSSGAATELFIGTRLVTILGGFVRAGSLVFVPMASSAYATGDQITLRSILIRGTRFAGLLAFSGAAVLILFGKPVIELWLGPGYNMSYWVLVVTTLGMLGPWVFSAATALLMGMRALNVLTIAVLSRSVLSITLAVACAFLFGTAGLAAGLAAPSLFVIGILMPLFACQQTNTRLRNLFTQALLHPLVVAAVVAVVTGTLLLIWPPKSLFLLLVECIAAAALFGFLALRWGLDHVTRNTLIASLPIWQGGTKCS